MFILNLNIQSLQSKYSSLKETLNIFKERAFTFDIICLQEIWNVDFPELFPLEGYHPLVTKCRKNKRGGGVGLYIRSNLTFEIKNDLSIFYDRILESLVVEITDERDNKFFVIVLYRSSGAHPTLSQAQQYTEFFQLFRKIWANHANFIALQYAGSEALKTDLTRTGKRTFTGMLRDLKTAIVRYYKNNFLTKVPCSLLFTEFHNPWFFGCHRSKSVPILVQNQGL